MPRTSKISFICVGNWQLYTKASCGRVWLIIASLSARGRRSLSAAALRPQTRHIRVADSHLSLREVASAQVLMSHILVLVCYLPMPSSFFALPVSSRYVESVRYEKVKIVIAQKLIAFVIRIDVVSRRQ